MQCDDMISVERFPLILFHSVRMELKTTFLMNIFTFDVATQDKFEEENIQRAH